tara:strand:- start:2245 stop:3441 length:1197 start_codon:yes stop_codon:yes gene_type:complete
MNQVFISNSLTPIIESAGPTTWASLAHTTAAGDVHATAMMGIWSPTKQLFLDGSTAALSLIAPDNVAKIVAADGTWVSDGIGEAGDIAANQHAITTQPTSPQWLNSEFQIVQAMPSGNPVASPIIRTSQVKSLIWQPYVAPAKHKIDLKTDAGVDVGGTVATTDVITIVLNVRFPQDILFYESQINPTGAISGLTPTLSAAFDNPKRVYKIEVVAGSATATTVSDTLTTNINAHGTLSKLVTASNGTNGVNLEAKLFGMVLDCSYLKEGTVVSTGKVVDVTDMTVGAGSFAEALGAEKKAQYSQGHLNRMYLPTGGVTSATATPGSAGTGYDRLIVEYVNATSSMPGFNNGGNTSRATIYTPNDTSFDAEASGIDYEEVWGLSRLDSDAAATAVEYNW